MLMLKKINPETNLYVVFDLMASIEVNSTVYIDGHEKIYTCTGFESNGNVCLSGGLTFPKECCHVVTHCTDVNQTDTYYLPFDDVFNLYKSAIDSDHLMIPFPTEKHGSFRDGRDIKLWMDGYLVGMVECLVGMMMEKQGNEPLAVYFDDNTLKMVDTNYPEPPQMTDEQKEQEGKRLYAQIQSIEKKLKTSKRKLDFFYLWHGFKLIGAPLLILFGLIAVLINRELRQALYNYTAYGVGKEKINEISDFIDEQLTHTAIITCLTILAIITFYRL